MFFSFVFLIWFSLFFKSFDFILDIMEAPGMQNKNNVKDIKRENRREKLWKRTKKTRKRKARKKTKRKKGKLVILESFLEWNKIIGNKKLKAALAALF